MLSMYLTSKKTHRFVSQALGICVLCFMLSGEATEAFAQSSNCPVDAQEGFELGLEILKADEPSTAQLETAVACFKQAERDEKLQKTMGVLIPLAEARTFEKMGDYQQAYRLVEQVVESASDEKRRNKLSTFLDKVRRRIANDADMPRRRQCRVALEIVELEDDDSPSLSRMIDGACDEGLDRMGEDTHERLADVVLDLSFDRGSDPSSRCTIYRRLLAGEGVDDQSAGYDQIITRHKSHCGGLPTGVLEANHSEAIGCPRRDPAKALEMGRAAQTNDDMHIALRCLERAARPDVEGALERHKRARAQLELAQLYLEGEWGRDLFRDELRDFGRGLEILRDDAPSTTQLETAVTYFERSEENPTLQKALGPLLPLFRARALDRMSAYDRAHRTVTRALADTSDARIQNKLSNFLDEVRRHVATDTNVASSEQCRMALAIVEREGENTMALGRMIDRACDEGLERMDVNRHERLVDAILELPLERSSNPESRCTIYRGLLNSNDLEYQSSRYERLVTLHETHCGGPPTDILTSRNLDAIGCPYREPSKAVETGQEARAEGDMQLAWQCLERATRSDIEDALEKSERQQAQLELARLHRERDAYRKAFQIVLDSLSLEEGRQMAGDLGKRLVPSSSRAACMKATRVVGSLPRADLQSTEPANRLLDRGCFGVVESLAPPQRRKLGRLLADVSSDWGEARGDVPRERCKLLARVVKYSGLSDTDDAIDAISYAYGEYCGEASRPRQLRQQYQKRINQTRRRQKQRRQRQQQRTRHWEQVGAYRNIAQLLNIGVGVLSTPQVHLTYTPSLQLWMFRLVGMVRWTSVEDDSPALRSHVYYGGGMGIGGFFNVGADSPPSLWKFDIIIGPSIVQGSCTNWEREESDGSSSDDEEESNVNCLQRANDGRRGFTVSIRPGIIGWDFVKFEIPIEYSTLEQRSLNVGMSLSVQLPYPFASSGEDSESEQ